MLLVPRHVRKIDDSEGYPLENPLKALDEFRDQIAWVLLGEPGAGKTEAFKKEAKDSDSQYLTISEFIYTDVISQWQGKTLFLDGLDEVRAGSDSGSVLVQIRGKLRHLGNPRFRIACRAADWYGSTDHDDIKDASPDGQVLRLLLEPLTTVEIVAILHENHKVKKPSAFIDRAQTLGVDNLLGNPQTLGLLAKAIRDSQWPATRKETFQLACETLAEESNKRHRNIKRNRPYSTDKLLDAAGQLCAAMLLSDKTGVALDSEQADERFPHLDEYAPPERDMAYEAVRRPLFHQEKEECFVPSHRSIAEYLAARWLATRIDGYGLPLGRVLNLMLGRDGRTVASLRGLYGWLTLHCQAARNRLIEADPLTVVVYGDAKPLSPTDKRHILTGLKREAKRYAAFHWGTSSSHSLGALAEPELAEDFITALELPERDNATQSFTDCILDIIFQGEAIPQLAAVVKNVATDDSRWGRVRMTALQAWLKLETTSHEALAMLDAITEGQVNDPDDELAGLLLLHLYPGSIAPETLFRYLHTPKHSSLSGHFVWFWEHEMPSNAPESHLSTLLDKLAARADPYPIFNIYEFHLSGMVGALLVRGIQLQDEQITNERLFAWLGIGADEFGEIQREDSQRIQIANWLEAHPKRYKALLLLCFNQCDKDDHPGYCIQICGHRLHGAASPKNIGHWHLEQASLTSHDTLAQIHLSEAVNTLMYPLGNSALTLEQIEDWANNYPDRMRWLQSLLVWDIPEWRLERAEKARGRNQQRANDRRDRTIHISEYISNIKTGTASTNIMHHLAGIWKNHYIDIRGESPSERFDNYCENGQEVLTAAESGFLHCPVRTDLPTVAEIIGLAINQREHYIRMPCLIGMELRWQQGSSQIHSLSDDALRCMVAFRLTYGADNTPDWFTHLVVEHPTLVAEVLIDYAGAVLKTQQLHIDSIYQFEHDPDYRMVALIAVPIILKHFPVRSRADHLRHLEYLLKAALRYHIDQLPMLLKKKMALKSIDVAQKIYWLTAGMLFDPGQYEATLWQYIGKSWTRAKHLSGFLRGDFRGMSTNYRLSASTIGKLIELLAPHAELEWPRGGGVVSETMRRGDHIRSLVNRLGASGTEEAAGEIERLLGVPVLKKLKFALEEAQHQLRLKQRESEFRYLPLKGVAKILANAEPGNTPDLAALVLDYLSEIAREIRQDNDDGYRLFWTEADPNCPKKENSCRDALLTKLRPRLTPFGIGCQPEVDHVNDKRADILVSYDNRLELPIEIKRDSNKTLWIALRSQLIEQYSIAPKAAGHGVYLVFWFGGEHIPSATDGGKKPRTPEELKSRLEDQLTPTEQRQIFVRVLDVSWPAPTGVKTLTSAICSKE